MAEAVGITLTGNADAITATIQGIGWTQLADGVEAASKAATPMLVIGGLKGSEQNPPVTHGHVVVVVSGDLARGKYPHAYWGTLGGVGKKNATVNYAWKTGDRDQVHYGAKALP